MTETIKTNRYEHVKDCLEGARNGRFCAGAEAGAAEIARLTDALEQATRKYDLLANAVNDDGDHCDDECDSIAHSDACNQAGTELVIRQKERIQQLEAALNQYGDHVSGCLVGSVQGCTCGFGALIAGEKRSG